MSDFNIRCIWHIIAKIGDKGFGTVNTFFRFWIYLSAEFSFLNLCCDIFSLLKLWITIQTTLCIGMSHFDDKNGSKGFWVKVFALLTFGPFDAFSIQTPYKECIAIYTPHIYFFYVKWRYINELLGSKLKLKDV